MHPKTKESGAYQPMEVFGLTWMELPENIVEIAGYIASALVFLSFCMKTLIPLRVVAILSNIAFIVYAISAGLTPILMLHSALLPLNILRTYQQISMFRQVRATTHGHAAAEALVPFMTRRHYPQGTLLFSKNDRADDIYYIVEGTITLPEIGKQLTKGTLFGEVGLFTPDRVRTGSARCATDCVLNVIGYEDLTRLCLRDPAFGLYLTKLITGRMVENQEQRQAQASEGDTHLRKV